MAINLSGAEQRDLFERIAHMVAMEVSGTDIARAVGLDPARISRIKDEPAFQEILGSIMSEKFEQDRDINDGLDAIEKQAIASVLRYMNGVQNPDYALKALAVVNKANRKGMSAANKPIQAEVGKTVTIHLQQNFVQAVSQNGLDARPMTIDGAPKKHEQVLPPQQVENILNLPKVKNVDDETVVGIAKLMGSLEIPKEVKETAFVDL